MCAMRFVYSRAELADIAISHSQVFNLPPGLRELCDLCLSPVVELVDEVEDVCQ